MELHIVRMAEAEKDPGVIIVTDDDDDDDWPDTGPQNIKEAKAYMDKIVNEFETFGELIHQDNKDALPKTICNLKKIKAKHWASMELADLEVVIRLISDPGCLHLWQHMTRGAGSSGPSTRCPQAMDVHPQAARKTI